MWNQPSASACTDGDAARRARGPAAAARTAGWCPCERTQIGWGLSGAAVAAGLAGAQAHLHPVERLSHRGRLLAGLLQGDRARSRWCGSRRAAGPGTARGRRRRSPAGRGEPELRKRAFLVCRGLTATSRASPPNSGGLPGNTSIRSSRSSLVEPLAGDLVLEVHGGTPKKGGQQADVEPEAVVQGGRVEHPLLGAQLERAVARVSAMACSSRSDADDALGVATGVAGEQHEGGRDARRPVSGGGRR